MNEGYWLALGLAIFIVGFGMGIIFEGGNIAQNCHLMGVTTIHGKTYSCFPDDERLKRGGR